MHAYQKYAAKRIYDEPSVGLFLDMGLGKTISTLMAIRRLLNEFKVQRVLIIAPKRVAEHTWSSEVNKWEQTKHLSLTRIIGTKKQRLEALEHWTDIYVVSVDNLQWLIDQNKWKFDMVVIDEASSFKNHKSKRLVSLLKVRPKIKRLVELTGTPAPNNLLDIWSLIYLLDGGKRLGTNFNQFRARYFVPGAKNGYQVFNWKLASGSAQLIHEAIQDITVSMKAVDYLKMPKLTHNTIRVELSSKERKLYDELERDSIIEFEKGDVVAESAATLTTKLLQLANGQVYNEHGDIQPVHRKKLEALKEIVAESNGQPILVFYNFKHDLAIIERELDIVKLKGEKEIDAWNRGEIPILCAHPRSAGHGLNLQQGGHIAVWYGLTYSLEAYEQANARLYRQGQDQPVIIHHIETADSMDQQVMKILQKKQTGQDALMQAVKARIKEVLR